MCSRSFVQTLNPLNSKIEWKIIDDDYDYNQEIATSCYGDMLHDDERNKKFGQALKKAIDKFHFIGKEAHVLDIGTGTGLLSMLAVRYGADSVTACEAFLPMANCAVSVINENGMENKIKVIKSHSTSLVVDENGDLKSKANILVSEVFDTELIGEGAIKTFNHAFEHLLTEDAIVIPYSGTVYAQVIESNTALNWNKLQDWLYENKVLLQVPKEIKNCSGAGAVHDIQLSEFNQKYFKALSDPIPIFRFDWAKNKKILTKRQMKCAVKAISSGKAEVVFMWWELNMDEEGDIVISCAPVWEHPDGKGRSLDVKTLTKVLPWRDHWMQAVYFFSNEISLVKDETFTLISNHDEFSFWFEIDDGRLEDGTLETIRPVCKCAFHFLLSRSRIGGMNDQLRRKKYLKTLEEAVTKNTICVMLGDFSLLPFAAARLGARKVYVVSESTSAEKVCHLLKVENELTDVVSVRTDVEQVIKSLNEEFGEDSLDVLIMSEPYFRNSILPWENLAFWYGKKEFVDSAKFLTNVKNIRTIPWKARLIGIAVEFDNLWRIATPLKVCEGFSMEVFDNLIEGAKTKAESGAEAQPLWEYPGVALSEPLVFLELDLTDDVPKERIHKNGTLELKWNGRCDGVALWMEYALTSDCFLSFGPLSSVVVGDYVTWDMYERQGVHLFRKNGDVRKGDVMSYSMEFDPNEGEIKFFFRLC